MNTDWNNELETRLIEAKMRTNDAAESVEHERGRPFMLLRPRVFIEGNQWCALYGNNLQDGVAGFGETPAIASVDFDIQWLNAKAARAAEGDGK